MRNRRARVVLVLSAAVAFAVVAAPTSAQLLPGPTTTTTTTAPSSTTSAPSSSTTPTTAPGSTTTAPDSTTTTTGLLDRPAATTTTTTAPSDPDADPGTDDPFAPDDGSTPAPPGAGDGTDGEGSTQPPAGSSGGVPSEARRIIDSVVRSGPSSSAELLAAVEDLVALGLSRDEAIRIGFGRFPIAGEARYTHDWLFPRYGPGFRFHLGTDVFAAYGTPLRAAVAGTVTSRRENLGGLSVKIHMEDGTFLYYAHLSDLVDGFEEDMAVEVGDVIGYVGDSGNARGGSPHLHFGVYPQGGAATDPKPILDRFLTDALDQLPAVVEQVRANAGSAPVDVPLGGGDALRRTPRSLLGTSLVRPLLARTDRDHVSTDALLAATADPVAGATDVAVEEARRMAAGVDWRAWVEESVRRGGDDTAAQSLRGG